MESRSSSSTVMDIVITMLFYCNYNSRSNSGGFGPKRRVEPAKIKALRDGGAEWLLVALHDVHEPEVAGRIGPPEIEVFFAHVECVDGKSTTPAVKVGDRA